MRQQKTYAGGPIRDYTGEVFGRVKVLRKVHNNQSGFPSYECRCECGHTYTITRPERARTCTQCRGLRPFESLYNHLGRTGKHEVLMSFSEFLEFTEVHECHYCSLPIEWFPRGVVMRSNLDRKDSRKGYSKENCVVCCSRCNRAKNNHFTYEEWVKIGALIKTWHI